jgi:hypothetical protein
VDCIFGYVDLVVRERASMSGRGILNVVKVLNDAIKHMSKEDSIPIYGDSHASTSIRDVSTGALILGFSPRIEKQLSNNEPMIDSARRFPPPGLFTVPFVTAFFNNDSYSGVWGQRIGEIPCATSLTDWVAAALTVAFATGHLPRDATASHNETNGTMKVLELETASDAKALPRQEEVYR